MLREGLVALVVAAPFGMGLTTGGAEAPEPLFRFEDPAIVESSGLAVVDGLVATVNDSGDEARVFAVDPATGQTVGVTRWPAEAVDVEALAPGEGDQVWVGDIGDNARSRDTVSVTRVPVGRGERSAPGTTYRLRYPDGPADAEALLVHPRSGRLVVVTKGIFGGGAYAAPKDPTGDPQRLRELGRVMAVVTDGAFFPDGRHFVLRDYSRAVVYSWPQLEAVGEVDLPPQQQGEGIAVTDEGSLLVSSEGQRAPVHEVDLPRRVEAAMSGPPPRISREGEELPEDDPGARDPTQWLIGTGLAVVAFLVLWRALRPDRKNIPR